jgi:hypothetical protein
MEYNEHTYTIKEKKEDILETIIEKGGITVDFTLGSHERAVTDNEKTLREITAKYKHEKLIKENIEEHHPFVLELDPMQVNTVHMYAEACEVVKQYEPKIAEFEKAIETDKKEIEALKIFLNGETK